ncbi:MAG: InlB B-repeat-containing protein, partial [Acholeplasmatales bacterium]|nr:InlB B-repeat-containing protein [Acholeplasmatales bacterium]
MKNKSKKLFKFLYLLTLPILFFTILGFSSCTIKPIQYTISFDTDNGSLVSAQILGENEKVVEPKDPTKDGYIFHGWYTNTDHATKYDFDTIVEHSFTLYSYWEYDDKFERRYTVNFEVDGIIYQTSSDFLYGTLPTYNASIPTKQSSAQYDYTFSSWSPSIKEVTSDATYTAVFVLTIRSYTVTFLDSDNSVLQTTSLYYGSIPSYNLQTPTKESTELYDYTFLSWNQALNPVSSDITYTPLFSSEIRNYNITFVNYNNQVLQKSLVAYGALPVYTELTPIKPFTYQYNYLFDGWDNELTIVTSDATYTAIFIESIRKYSISFLNYDLVVLQNSLVDYGTLPVYESPTPIKPSSAEFDYTFNEWDNEITIVSKDASYIALYTNQVRSYNVTFVDYNGELLQSFELLYGELPSYSLELPYRPTTEQYYYTFSSWDNEITTVVSDALYTAEYYFILREYIINFENYDNTVLQSSSVSYGFLPEYLGDTPTKQPDEMYYYEFDEWTIQIETVTGDATYTAFYIPILRSYTITFSNSNGDILQSSLVEYGTLPSFLGSVPTIESSIAFDYSFIEFTPLVLPVSEDAVYTATYSSLLRNYTITFLDNDLEVVQSTVLEYGSLPEYTGALLVILSNDEFDYTFDAWNPTISSVVGDQTYEATFTQIRRSYSIVFKNYDLTQLQNTEVEYGTLPVYQGETPTKPS